MDPSKFYDDIASSFEELSKPREQYILGVESVVVEVAGELGKIENYLDIGSGDGRRAIRIASKIKAKKLTIVEPSKRMLDQVERPSRGSLELEAHQSSAEDIHKILRGRKYRLITALWNVFGHVPDKTTRLKALRNIKLLLAEGGRAVFDVSNRYNSSAYGEEKAKYRRKLDKENPGGIFGENGDFYYTVEAKGRAVPAWGHSFSPYEIVRLIGEAGLRVHRRVSVNYDTGKIERQDENGQLLYVVS